MFKMFRRCFPAGLFFLFAPVVLAQPVITNQPAGVIANTGDTVSFTVGATGAQRYSWRRYPFYFLTIGTNAVLTLTNVHTSDSGNFFCVLSNATGTVTSSVVTLTVLAPTNVPPAISKQPVNTATNAGATFNAFSVTAGGTDPLSYTWWFNGTPIPDSNSNVLAFVNLQTNRAGNYFVVVANAYGAVTSGVVTLTVWPREPLFSIQPADATVGAGASVMLSAAVTGTPSFSYRWFLDGTNIYSSVSAGGSVSIFLPNVQAGQYYVIVTNDYGSVTSRVATVTVITTPLITRQPVSVTTNAGATVSFTVAATNGTHGGFQPPGPGYSWWFNGAPLPGKNAVTLTLANVQDIQAGEYFVVATNSYGATTSSIATLTVLLTPPSITGQPGNIVASAGANVFLSVVAAGSTPFNYHWFFNGNPTGTNAWMLSFNNIQTNQAGNYFVIVDNAYGSVTSQVSTVTVTVLGAPIITNQPVSITTNVGAIVRFGVGVTNSGGGGVSPPSLRYQWWFSGSNAPVGSAAGLLMGNVKSNKAGSYFCIITNAAGAVTSSVVTLTLYTVGATNSPGVTLLYHSPSNDVLKLVLDPGKNYRIQSSADLVTWLDDTNFFSDVPLMYYTNDVPADERLYYRLTSP